MKLAVIDLGTNTCNLLIAEGDQQNYSILYQGKEGVKLGKGGINKKILTPEAFQRAAEALKKHKKTIVDYQVSQVTTIATSAVRDAANKAEFAAYLLNETGLELTIISGEEEAALIFKGVKLAFGNIPDQTLILDIGGGSNEFILTQDNDMLWKKSFPMGMSRVIEQFPVSDPVTKKEMKAIESYFRNGLSDLQIRLREIQIDRLVGCSGAFDTLADLIDRTAPGSKQRITQDINRSVFEQICDKIIQSTATQREKMTGMDPLRVEMIVPSFIFIQFILKSFNIKKITQTGFSLREGVLQEWINR